MTPAAWIPVLLGVAVLLISAFMLGERHGQKLYACVVQTEGGALWVPGCRYVKTTPR